MNKSENVDQLAKALAAAQGEMKNPPKDGQNPHYQSRFATLVAVREAVIPVLARHGLSVIQSAGAGERGPSLTTLLLHASGQWVETDALTLPAARQDPQGYCSALTYARRYGLMTLAGVVGDDDDDGAAASAPPPKTPPAKKPAPAGPPAALEAVRDAGPAVRGAAPAPVPAGQQLGLSPAQFQLWVLSRDADLAAAGRSKPGQLVAAVVGAGRAEGYSDDLASWPRDGYPVARQAIKAFEVAHVGAATAG